MSDENVIFMDFFAVKVDGSDVIAGSVKRFSYREIPAMDITSVNFNREKVHGDDIFVQQDILQFFSGEFKDYKYLKSPSDIKLIAIKA